MNMRKDMDKAITHPRPNSIVAHPFLLMVTFFVLGVSTGATAASLPNIVLIVTDDQGYSDVGVFGAKGFQTPHLDRLARDGRRFTDFYVAASVCTASRAALMTGCYPNRVSMFGALNHTSREGLHPDEVLLPEVLKTKGYATACYGKWHLGTVVEFFPTRQGFDEFYGIPYSNDNSKYHPVVADMPPLPLYENETVIAFDPDQSLFTRRLTEKSVDFIEEDCWCTVRAAHLAEQVGRGDVHGLNGPWHQGFGDLKRPCLAGARFG